jgi:hypothetical protein
MTVHLRKQHRTLSTLHSTKEYSCRIPIYRRIDRNMDRRGLQALTRDRLMDARALLRAHRCSGAYYMAGYAVECALKACIAKRTNGHNFPYNKLVNDSYGDDRQSRSTLSTRRCFRTRNLGLIGLNPDGYLVWEAVVTARYRSLPSASYLGFRRNPTGITEVRSARLPHNVRRVLLLDNHLGCGRKPLKSGSYGQAHRWADCSAGPQTARTGRPVIWSGTLKRRVVWLALGTGSGVPIKSAHAADRRVQYFLTVRSVPSAARRTETACLITIRHS